VQRAAAVIHEQQFGFTGARFGARFRTIHRSLKRQQGLKADIMHCVSAYTVLTTQLFVLVFAQDAGNHTVRCFYTNLGKPGG
jgi:hypothetical protein